MDAAAPVTEIPGTDSTRGDLEKLPPEDVARLIQKSLDAIALILLGSDDAQKAGLIENRTSLQGTLNLQHTFLSHIKQPKGTRPFAVIRKLLRKREYFVALDIGKEMPDGTHYGRVFFGEDLTPVWMKVNPKTGNIIDKTVYFQQ
ncbi:MAG: hypothetical protein WC753_00285 [Candidatus Gracilibacteria bacterium]